VGGGYPKRCGRVFALLPDQSTLLDFFAIPAFFPAISSHILPAVKGMRLLLVSGLIIHWECLFHE
jgi:hypothetical protein